MQQTHSLGPAAPSTSQAGPLQTLQLDIAFPIPSAYSRVSNRDWTEAWLRRWYVAVDDGGVSTSLPEIYEHYTGSGHKRRKVAMRGHGCGQGLESRLLTDWQGSQEVPQEVPDVAAFKL